MFEKRDVNSRGELWIGEAFHLANLPTHLSHSLCQIIPDPAVSLRFMQPFSFFLLIASFAFALPAKSAEHKLLKSEDFSKTIAKGYWSVL